MPDGDEAEVGLAEQAEEREVAKGIDVGEVAQGGRCGEERGDEAGAGAAEVVAVVGKADGDGRRRAVRVAGER